MVDTKVIFSLDGFETTIKCTKSDKMKDICQKFSTSINKNMNTLLFLHEGNKINLDLNFEEQSKFQGNTEIKILVYKNINGIKIYSKNKLKVELNNQKINDIISRNNTIKNMVNEVKTSIEVMNIKKK